MTRKATVESATYLTCAIALSCLQVAACLSVRAVKKISILSFLSSIPPNQNYHRMHKQDAPKSGRKDRVHESGDPGDRLRLTGWASVPDWFYECPRKRCQKRVSHISQSIMHRISQHSGG
ncbi:hypothetical protein IW261DRAFT_785703 [Armillaria novae-zelandiae]|uniref:C2H2-type domain-containing protein n=1 Tax=Armillaria novae-zelandiae TaxID=153914 RepID=A0AA39PKY3_9AGAR|nr:hypothetical protein IW261DRAFT_785703 [Armillaria novae-zelandiae]